ncbi:hypothetical protein NADFUDRAFT_64588 [Nadsonia fulvescens var. elongata DSM 6958]|uniref:Uncharacterized protein n=1 Tax=Nadsonia fulvescens var. elongata DSM 6958 TaxID=857566 RepID=A0A1E3PR88_9ASCO|nr:hypothetical protein NADFUDRAFT_64588 [Nadsonia fulvescens var. elongata DSM 6958]
MDIPSNPILDDAWLKFIHLTINAFGFFVAGFGFQQFLGALSAIYDLAPSVHEISYRLGNVITVFAFMMYHVFDNHGWIHGHFFIRNSFYISLMLAYVAVLLFLMVRYRNRLHLSLPTNE